MRRSSSTATKQLNRTATIAQDDIDESEEQPSNSTLLIECINEREIDETDAKSMSPNVSADRARDLTWVQHFDLYSKNESSFVRHLGKNYWNFSNGNLPVSSQRRLVLDLGSNFDSLSLDSISEKYFVVVGLTDLNNRPKRSNVTLNFKTNSFELARRSSTSLADGRSGESNYLFNYFLSLLRAIEPQLILNHLPECRREPRTGPCGGWRRFGVFEQSHSGAIGCSVPQRPEAVAAATNSATTTTTESIGQQSLLLPRERSNARLERVDERIQC